MSKEPAEGAIPPVSAAAAPGPRSSARGRMALRSDWGTFVLHWALVIAMVLAMLTGFRLTWDNDLTGFAHKITPILMQGDVWSIHFYSAWAMFAVASGYIVYLYRAALFSRNALSRLKLLTLPAPAKLKWQSVNIGLHWLFYGLMIVMMVTGVLLYLGWGGLVVFIHSMVAIALVAYLLLHIAGHFMQGGWAQIFRIFLPVALTQGPLVRAFPFAVALAVGAAGAMLTLGLDLGTRDELTVRLIQQAPKLDGVLDDAAWQGAPVVRVRTQQGFNLADGKGESLVEIRAVRDDTHAYFAFRWQDPSRSLKRLPLVKKADGWHMMHNAADTADESAFYEDKFAVLFSRKDAFGNGDTTHMGPKPLADKPGALNGRGLHYTQDGSYADMWQWKASRGGLLGKMDDMHIGPPLPANEAQVAGRERYSAGYIQDPGKAFYVYNYLTEPPGGYRGPVKLRRLPKDHAAMTAKLGKIDLRSGASDDEGSQWWMLEGETEPYSQALDDTIPVGTVMPSTMIIGTYEGDRADVDAAPRWKDGWWTLEARRKLASESKYDVDFTREKTLYVWVSVFDHNQTRHTRHVRPVKLRIP